MPGKGNVPIPVGATQVCKEEGARVPKEDFYFRQV